MENNDKEDSARKARIIAHMNAAHRDSLSLFLRHYCTLSAESASSASLSALSLDSLTLFTSEGSSKRDRRDYYIPLRPAMSSLSEVRARMKAMHQECLAGLDLSGVGITTYVGPQSLLDYLVVSLVVVSVLSFSRRANFRAGSYLYEICALRTVPKLAAICFVIQPWFIPALVCVQIAQGWRMASTRSRRYGITRWSRLWWMWVASCFLDGHRSLQRFDELARSKELEKEQIEKQMGEKEKGRKNGDKD